MIVLCPIGPTGDRFCDSETDVSKTKFSNMKKIAEKLSVKVARTVKIVVIKRKFLFTKYD